jgi:type I restriction enzyme S subunit
MVKDGKLKAKDIKNDTVIFVGEDNLHYEKFADGSVKCIEDEIPFDVPEGWAWCRLLLLTIKIGAGSTPTGGAAVYSSSGIKFIRSQNVYDDGLLLDDVAYISEEINKKKSGSIVKPKDILLNITGGSIGRCALVPDDFDIANVNQHVIIIRLVEPEFQQYLHKVITSPYIQNQILSRQVGSGRGGLSAETLSTFLIPVPPIEEQRTIQSKIAECLLLVSSIAKEKENISDLCAITKSKILDLAIRGQLVPQDPNDEPAYVLLERIRAEKEELIKAGKIKRDKKESIIFRGEDNSYYEKIDGEVRCIDEEIPFEIPDTWNWCRGFSCFAGMESKKPFGEFFDYIDIDSIDNRLHRIKEPKHLPVSNAPSRANRAVLNGSVLFSLVRPYLENIAFVDENYANCIASTGFYICNSQGALFPEYMFYLMISRYVVDGLNQFMKGDNSPSISKNNIENWLYPIPPMNEQKMICQKLKMIITKIETIEKGLS